MPTYPNKNTLPRSLAPSWGLAVGAVVGSLWAAAAAQQYYDRLPDFGGEYRLLLLVPGELSDRAKATLARWVSATRTRAVQYVAVNLFQRVMRYVLVCLRGS